MNQVLVAQRARQAYQVAQVDSEDRMGLIVRLYDGMLGFLRRGAEAVSAGERREAAEAVRRATEIIGELQAVLNLEEGGEIASNLDRLYSYARRRVIESHAAADPAGLLEVVRLLTPLRDAWSEANVRQHAPAGV